MNSRLQKYSKSSLRSFVRSIHFERNLCVQRTPLMKVFNTMPLRPVVNPFTERVGILGYPSLIEVEGLVGLKYHAVSTADKYLFECLDPNRDRKLVQIFDDLSDTLCQVADLAEFLRLMHPDVDMSFEAREICIELGQLVEKLNTNKKLYNCIKEVAEKGDKFPMNEVEKHIANLFVFDFELCGIHLSENDRKEVVHYNDCILQLGQKFASKAAQPRLFDKSAAPPGMCQYFNVTDEGNLLVHGFDNIQDEFIREYTYKTFLAPNEAQEKLLDDVLMYRHKLAEKCGFPSYAHRAIRGGTAGSPEFVSEFLDSLNESFREYANNDFELMKNIKAAESNQEFGMWDVAYYTTKIKREWLKVSPKMFEPYFSLGSCMSGLDYLCQHLFGISLIHEQLVPYENWVPEIYKLRVEHYKEGVLGHIYCDFYERPAKPNQDCHFTIKGGRRLSDGSYQNPIVVIVLNLPLPGKSKPCLLTPHMVENLFHEMGHALHSMLGRAEYQHVTGTRCPTDFAEVPSILMEYFASDTRVLRKFANHYDTGEPIPEYYLEQLCNSKKICTASELQSQIFYSALDFAYHTDKSSPGRTTKVLKEIQAKYYPVSYVEETAWQLKFSHLIGYGAKYYSYLMSRAIASSIWQTCFNEDPFDRRMGEKYRRECLTHGGAKPSRKLVEDFLNKKITPTTLTESLVREISSHQRKNS